MKYAHIIHFFNSEPWAILPEKLHAIISLIELKSAGLTLSQSEIDARIGPSRADVVSPAAVAVLPIVGTISHRAGLLQRASGGVSVEQFRADFRTAVNDPQVAAIVLDIDSPGGSTAGIEEMAEEIYSARGKKRIIASVNSLAASAGYWLATSAHEIALTPSGHVGSIGVLGVHMDFSDKAKSDGINVTVVSAGKYKAEASEFIPMSDEAKQHLQGIVNDRYEAFIGAVARGRKVSQKRVRNGFGEGRLVTAREALSMGMVDSIETMDSVLSRTSGRAERAKKIAETTSWEFARIGDEGLSELSSTVMSVTATDMISQNREDFRAQMLIVSKDKWSSLDDARTWAKEKGYRADRVEEVGETWRLFQRDQSDFQSLRSVDLDSGIMAVGGQLKGGVSSVFRDADAEGVDEFLTVGVIPQDVSDELAAEGTKWSEPTIASFTSKAWEELTEDERRHIARHAAWCKAMPPERFEDIRLFYHEAEGGAIVPNGIRAALAQLADDDLGEAKPRIQARLSYHMAAIDKRNEQTKGDPSLDPERVELELMELG